MSVFTKCDKGHDLTLPDSYVYTNSGVRACRECAKDDKGKIKKRPAFDMFRKD
jgi:hypothetical protein